MGTRGRRHVPDGPGAGARRSAAGEPAMVVIGASGGEGLRQMIALVEALPPGLGAAILLVLHRPADQLSHLPEILRRRSRLPVRLARQGEGFEAGVCYLGAPAEHLAIGPGATADLTLDHAFRNRTVDLLFSTAAAHGGAAVVGVILAGALSDGSRGLAAIRHAGGRALVLAPQDPTEAGMPAAAMRSVRDAEVFTEPEQVARRLVQLVGVESGVLAED